MTELTSDSTGNADTGENIIGFGHSHLSALMRAGRRMQNSGALGSTHLHFVRLNHKTNLPNFLIHEGVRDIHPDLQRRLRFILKRDAPKALFLSLMGNEYNSIGMLKHPEPFDFHWPEMDLPADPKLTVIPFDLMKAQLRSMANSSSLLFWRYFSSIYDGPMFFVPPPPPIADEAHIKSYPGAFADRVAEFGLSSPESRLKMWMLYCEVLREAINGSSTKFVELPLEIFDAGYLKSIYWQQDPTHGNEAYGNVVLQKLLTLANARIASSAEAVS
jgi:hypothetical protein